MWMAVKGTEKWMKLVRFHTKFLDCLSILSMPIVWTALIVFFQCLLTDQWLWRTSNEIEKPECACMSGSDFCTDVSTGPCLLPLPQLASHTQLGNASMVLIIRAVVTNQKWSKLIYQLSRYVSKKKKNPCKLWLIIGFLTLASCSRQMNWSRTDRVLLCSNSTLIKVLIKTDLTLTTCLISASSQTLLRNVTSPNSYEEIW